MKMISIVGAVSGPLLLGACATTPPSVAPGAAPPVAYAPNPYSGASANGPADVLGRTARALTALFGPPRLDIREGAGHKLQFLDERCVLDTYLYAKRAGEDAVVTHVEARDRQGKDMPTAQCTALLRRP